MVSFTGTSSVMKSPSSPFARTHGEQDSGKIIKKRKSVSIVEGKPHTVSLLKDCNSVASQKLLAAIADYGFKLVNPSYAFINLSEPLSHFKAELKNGKIEHYFKERCAYLVEAFETRKMCWVECCRSIDDLLHSKIALLDLAVKIKPPHLDSPELFNSIVELLDTTISRLEKMTVHEAPDLCYAMLHQYEHIFQERVLKSHALSEVTQLTPEEIELPYAMTLDPVHKRYFVHLKKAIEQNIFSPLDGKVVYEALMITEGDIEKVNDISFTRMLYQEEIDLMRKFIHVPFIEKPPLAIVEYEEKNELFHGIQMAKVSYLCHPLVSHFGVYGKFIPECSKLETFIFLLCDAAKGIFALHKEGYIHGDITPESLFVFIGPDGKARGVVGKLDGTRKARQKGMRLRAMSSGSGKRFSIMRDPRREIAPLIPANSLYTAPENWIIKGEFRSKKEDIWAFGITIWQCLYGKDSEESPFQKFIDAESERGLESMTQIEAYLTLGEKFPPPKTRQEDALQKTIRECLYVNPEERIDSAKLVELLEGVMKAESVPLKKQQSLHDLFQPFTDFEKQMEIQEKKSPSLKLSRRSSVHSLGTAGTLSLPPELFDLFCEEGKLRSHIDTVEKLIDETLLDHPVPFSEIIDCENGLEGTYHVFEELEKKITRFTPYHSKALLSRKENICELRLKLSYLQEKLHNTLIKGGEGLTYGEFCKYRLFGENHFKRKKKPVESIEEGAYSFPLSYHFPKNCEEGHRHALTLNPMTKAIFVHLKKTGFRSQPLGKGAEKAVHAAIKIQGWTLELVADIVMRVDGKFNYTEEKLKINLEECSYIEKPSYAITVYEKEEIPGLWKQKQDLSPEEITLMKQTTPKVKVKKVAFLAFQFFCSLNSLSYELKEKREIPLLIKLLRDALHGLAYMHENGYLHRDLKAGNIFVKRENTSEELYTGIIGDLGEVAYVGVKGKLLQKARMAGTLYYSAPEMCYDKEDVRYRNQSFASDIWAFGVLACQVLYGNDGRDIPFIDNESPLHIFYQLKELTQEQVDTALDVRFRHPEAPAEHAMQKMIRCCLQINPDLRPTASTLNQKF